MVLFQKAGIRIAIVLIFVLSLAANLYLTRANLRLSTEKDQLKEFAIADSSHIEFYKNKANELTARVNVLELSRRDAKDLSESDKLKPVKKFKGVKNNLRNVDQVTNIDAKIDTTLRLDSSFVWRSPYSTIQVNPEFKTVLVDIKVPLTGAMFWQRKKILGLRIGRKQWRTDISTENPLVKITGLEVIKIQKRKN